MNRSRSESAYAGQYVGSARHAPAFVPRLAVSMPQVRGAVCRRYSRGDSSFGFVPSSRIYTQARHDLNGRLIASHDAWGDQVLRRLRCTPEPAIPSRPALTSRSNIDPFLSITTTIKACASGLSSTHDSTTTPSHVESWSRVNWSLIPS